MHQRVQENFSDKEANGLTLYLCIDNNMVENGQNRKHRVQ